MCSSTPITPSARLHAAAAARPTCCASCSTRSPGGSRASSEPASQASPGSQCRCARNARSPKRSSLRPRCCHTTRPLASTSKIDGTISPGPRTRSRARERARSVSSIQRAAKPVASRAARMRPTGPGARTTKRAPQRSRSRRCRSRRTSWRAQTGHAAVFMVTTTTCPSLARAQVEGSTVDVDQPGRQGRTASSRGREEDPEEGGPQHAGILAALRRGRVPAGPGRAYPMTNRLRGFALGSLLLCPGFAHAQLASLELSPDITVAIGGEVLGPEEVGRDNLAGVVTFTGTGVAIPIGANLHDFDRLPGGVDTLFATDITVNLGGGVVARPSDVVRVTAGVPSIAWSGSAAGLPPGTAIDAVGRYPDGDLLLSFDTTVSIGGVTADDEDLVRIDQPSGAVSLAFDGSALGVAAGLDLDAADALIDGRLLISFDGSGSVGGVNFSDEDALIFNPTSLAFGMAYDGSTQYAAWGAADLDALDGSLDPDHDGIADAADNCPFWAQVSSADNDGDKRGNECECTDQTGDGLNTVNDLVAINTAIFNPGLVTPLCDGNNDGLCNVNDILAANLEIFSPTNTSICGRQPFPGP